MIIGSPLTLRVLWNHLGLTLTVSASSEAAGYPASHLDSGNLHRFWRATATTDQTLTYDAGVGNVRTVDTVVVPEAARLAAVGAHVALQRSDDASSFSDVWALTPVMLGHLAAPDGRHLYKENEAQSRRAWRLRVYGTPSAVAEIAGGWFIGTATVLPTSPVYGREFGADRAHRGADLVASWPVLTDEGAVLIAATLAAVTPAWPAEAPHETLAGVAYGGLPHWLYDPTGRTLARTPAIGPRLYPVLCMTPEQAFTTSVLPGADQGPASVRWRVRR